MDKNRFFKKIFAILIFNYYFVVIETLAKMSTQKDYLHLHFIILLNSFIPKVFIAISIPSLETVFLRTLMAVVMLACYIFWKKLDFKIPINLRFKLILIGMVTSAYWILLSDSAKLSNASVTLVGIATTSIWVSFINLYMNRASVNAYQILSGLLAVIGVYIIYSSKFHYNLGFTVAIIAAVVGAWTTVLNGKVAQQCNHYIATFYLMMGASLGTCILLPFYNQYWRPINLNPTYEDLLMILGLAFVFSIYSFSVFIRIMKKISPFIVALTANLSPIYGIIFALLFSKKAEMMSPSFYMGAIVIIFSVFAYPLMEYMRKEDDI
ncbi:MAG: DMT family transporter [Bacteroidetes bacterium]|nr:MAG: DMT family transporter [Bacteroidota bacterium]